MHIPNRLVQRGLCDIQCVSIILDLLDLPKEFGKGCVGVLLAFSYDALFVGFESTGLVGESGGAELTLHDAHSAWDTSSLSNSGLLCRKKSPILAVYELIIGWCND